MFYTIYQITNTINNKIYIGKHQTKNLDDGYMGSGKHLNHAIKKYGIENFKKNILFYFNNEADMNAKEAELVTEEFCLREDTYNLCPGGKGGWGYVNNSSHIIKNSDKQREIAAINARKNLPKARETLRANGYSSLKRGRQSIRENYPEGTFKNKSHSEETKQKMRKSKNIGELNPAYGTMWITNGQENKKIKKDFDIIPERWYKGRVVIVPIQRIHDG